MMTYCSGISVNRIAGSCGLGLLPCWRLAPPVLPVDLLLLGEDGLDGFDKAQIGLVLVHVAVSARPVHIEPLLALHPLRGGAIRCPGLAIAGDPLPALRQGYQGPERGRNERDPTSCEDLHDGGGCACADNQNGENLGALLVGGGTLAIPAPLPFEVLLEILLGTSLTSFRAWIAFACLIRHGVLACSIRNCATIRRGQ